MKYLDNVVTLELDKAKCVGCKRCVQVCPHEVFSMNFYKAEIIKLDACIECGACQMNCPSNAINVDAGVGCAIALISRYLKKYKWLRPFASKDCC